MIYVNDDSVLDAGNFGEMLSFGRVAHWDSQYN